MQATGTSFAVFPVNEVSLNHSRYSFSTLRPGKGEQKMSGRAASLSYPWVIQFLPPAFSPDGRLFAVAAVAREVKVWDVMTGKSFRHQ